MTRCAAECDTPNNGPSWRIVKFVRHYVATNNPVRQVQSPLPTRPTIGNPLTTALGHHAHQPAELTRLQPRERGNPLLSRRRDHLHPHMINYHPAQPAPRVTRQPLAEDPTYGGPVRISKSDFARDLAHRILDELDAVPDPAADDAVIARRPLLRFVVERMLPVLTGPRWR